MRPVAAPGHFICGYFTDLEGPAQFFVDPFDHGLALNPPHSYYSLRNRHNITTQPFGPLTLKTKKQRVPGLIDGEWALVNPTLGRLDPDAG